jgi:serine/threonine protein kinase
VCDFGIARFKDRTFISTKNGVAGTPSYMAPEMFEGGPVTELVDVYSFGVLMWECLTGKVPWGQLVSPMQVIYVVGVLGDRLPVPQNAPPPLARLLRACWQEDPAARPGFKDILSVLKAEQERCWQQRRRMLSTE